MKTVSIFFTLIAIYMTWQISRVSLGYAIICGCVCFVLITWLLEKPNKAKVKYDEAKKASRNQQDLTNNK